MFKILVYIHVIKFKEKEKKNSLILYTFLFFLENEIFKLFRKKKITMSVF